MNTVPNPASTPERKRHACLLTPEPHTAAGAIVDLVRTGEELEASPGARGGGDSSQVGGPERGGRSRGVGAEPKGRRMDVEERVAARALRLYGVNKAWKLLATARPADSMALSSFDFETGGGPSFLAGVQDAERALLSAKDILLKQSTTAILLKQRASRMQPQQKPPAVSPTVALAQIQQAQGTCCYVRAAFLFDTPSAATWYDEANRHYLAAFQVLQEELGPSHLAVADCAIDLGISFGNRRRTIGSCASHKLASRVSRAGLCVRFKVRV